ncbi:hypothetical protein ABGB14_12805 [Nonomuraea sp. B10E15]|uniref:pentapeptide repeat-containing protein n=1 Tax=unclassified Nonomuraea TaxID=2593643 RepID=UPI00325DDE20
MAEADSPRSNVLYQGANSQQTAWVGSILDGSRFVRSSFSDCEFIDTSLRSDTFAQVSFDDSRMLKCSFNNVVIEASDVSGLVINGVNIGDLLAERKAEG